MTRKIRHLQSFISPITHARKERHQYLSSSIAYIKTMVTPSPQTSRAWTVTDLDAIHVDDWLSPPREWVSTHGLREYGRPRKRVMQDDSLQFRLANVNGLLALLPPPPRLASSINFTNRPEPDHREQQAIKAGQLQVYSQSQGSSATSFLTLPPELRLLVYSELFKPYWKYPGLYKVYPWYPKQRFFILNEYPWKCSTRRSSEYSAGILQTCHLIHGEATRVLFENTVFSRRFRWPSIVNYARKNILLPLSQASPITKIKADMIRRILLSGEEPRWFCSKVESEPLELKVLRDHHMLEHLEVHLGSNSKLEFILTLLRSVGTSRRHAQLRHFSVKFQIPTPDGTHNEREMSEWNDRWRGRKYLDQNPVLEQGQVVLSDFDFLPHVRCQRQIQSVIDLESLFIGRRLSWEYSVYFSHEPEVEEVGQGFCYVKFIAGCNTQSSHSLRYWVWGTSEENKSIYGQV